MAWPKNKNKKLGLYDSSSGHCHHPSWLLSPCFCPFQCTWYQYNSSSMSAHFSPFLKNCQWSSPHSKSHSRGSGPQAAMDLVPEIISWSHPLLFSLVHFSPATRPSLHLLNNPSNSLPQKLFTCNFLCLECSSPRGLHDSPPHTHKIFPQSHLHSGENFPDYPI